MLAQVEVEQLEKNKSKLTFGVEPKHFEEGMRFSYNKNKGRINIPGFRKGKAPRQIIEMHYGKEVFYDDAVNHVLPGAYEEASKQSGLDIIAKPELGVESIDENGVVFTAIVYTRPEVVLGQYKGLEYDHVSPDVTEEDILKHLVQDQDKNARIVSITGRPVQDGDILIIDFKGFIDDEAFEGGEAQGFELTIGTKQFIDTFEQQLVGANIGDTVQVHVNFPEQYHAEDLAGKPARFEVVIHEISMRELPEIDDALAQDVSEHDTLEEYKAEIRGLLAEDKANDARNANEEAVINALMKVAELELPDVAIDERTDQMLRDFSMQLSMSGISPADYFRYSGQDPFAIQRGYRENAERQLRARYALLAVAAAEGIEISDEERHEELGRIAENYNVSMEETKKILDSEDRLKELNDDILSRKALEILMDSAVAVYSE